MNQKNTVDVTVVEEIRKELISNEDYYVLHVDDDESIQIIFKDGLQEYGIKTISASSAQEALAILNQQAEKIFLIATDINMPIMDGFELRKNILNLNSQIPFCIVSGLVDKEIALKGIELKISGFLNKPLDFSEILGLIAKEGIPRIKNIKEDREFKLSFVSDTEQLLEESEEILLRLENDFSDMDSINRFYAIMHTIKGPAGFFEPKTLHNFVHAYEEIVKKIQRLELSHSESVIGALFKGFDVIKNLVFEIKSGLSKSHSMDELLKSLEIVQDDSSTSSEKDGDHTLHPDKQTQATKIKTQEDIKVSIKLLNEFMHLSGEVTVVRNMLNKCVSSIERRFAGDRDVGMLTELLTELHKINSGVQNKMSEIRKVPVKSVVKVLPRAVRDVAKALNKKIDLEITGDELRIDTSIAEVLNNSLLHIIKNSIDHGIEKPEDRLKRGKSDIGQIKVNATSKNDFVYVTISDDGKGLDAEAIKARLIKNGSHSKVEVDALSMQEIYSMIFSSGFSTAQQVTEISGRGVGMSMVKDSVEAIGGQILIDSRPGQGATFTLELPIPKSVLIASCLSVLVGTKRLSLIQDDIIKVFQFSDKQIENNIKKLEQSDFLVFNNELIPIVNLAKLFNITEPSIKKIQNDRCLILMKSGQDNRFMAVEVHEILDVEDMVIKTLHHNLNLKNYYRGVTFLDDGGVGLILNTSGIMDALNINRSRLKTNSDSNALAISDKEKTKKNVLVVGLDELGTFALPQELIFRIEEFRSEHIKRTGLSYVVAYRGKAMQIETLSSILKKESAKLKNNTMINNSDMLQIIVIQRENSFLGFVVDRILDMTSYHDLNTELSQPEKGIDGHLFINNQTVTLINWQIFEPILTRIVSRNVNDSPAA